MRHEEYMKLSREQKIALGNKVIKEIDGSISLLVWEVENRPPEVRGLPLADLVAKLTMTVAKDLAPIQLATMVAVAVLRLSGLDVRAALSQEESVEG